MKIHAVSANARLLLCLTLTPGSCHNIPTGRKLLETHRPKVRIVAMDKAYKDDHTRLWLELRMLSDRAAEYEST